MTPHYRAVVDIEISGVMIAYLRLVRPKHKHAPPFAKRPAGHRRRCARRFVRKNKEAWLHVQAA